MSDRGPGTQRLRRRDRLGRGGDIRSVLDKGTRWNGRDLRVVWLLNNAPFDRVAVLVSRRTGIAVVRNRVKRLLREVFRRNREPAVQHADIIMRVRNESRLEFSCLQEQYRQWRAQSIR